MVRPRAPLDGLRPVLGTSAADALENAWITGTDSDRSNIEVLSDLLRKRLQRGGMPLLSPPPPRLRTVPDGLSLGHLVHGTADLGPLSVPVTDLCTHMAILGRSGSGKSTLAVCMLLQLMARGVAWIAIDSKRALRQVAAMELPQRVKVLALGRSLPARLRFNPLCPPPGVPWDTHRRQVVELICRSWGAGDAVAALLDRVLASMPGTGSFHAPAGSASGLIGWPTLNDLRRALVELPLASREATWRQTAVRVLDQLTTGPLGNVLNDRRDCAAIDVLMEQFTILETDGLTTTDSAFLVHSLLQQLTARLQEPAREGSAGLRLCVFVDEAHRLLARHEGGRETPMELLLREGRSMGLGMILASQTLAGMSTTALANCATWVVMASRYRSDIGIAAQGLMLKDDERDVLGALEVGEAVVRLASRWAQPFMIRVPSLELPRQPVTDMAVSRAFLVGPFRRETLAIREAISASVRSATPDSAVSARFRSETTQSPAGRVLTPIPLPDHSPPAPLTANGTRVTLDIESSSLRWTLEQLDADRLLKHVAQDPLMPVTQRYAALDMSRRKGDAAKQTLIQQGYLVPVAIATPEGRVVLLELSDTARVWLARRRIKSAPINGSLLHAYWQARVARELERVGFTVELEYKRNGHAFDVYGERGGVTVLVEVETGKSSVRANLEQLSSSNCTHRAVVWVGGEKPADLGEHVHLGLRFLLPQGVSRWARSLR